MEITKKRTLIILDWDDTLFPTSWVMDNNLDLTDPSVRATFNIKFEELDNILYKFLCRMSKLGKVIIITNAMPEWVHLSGSLLRNTNGILKKITIISARKEHHQHEEMKNWKKLCFLDELIKHNVKYKTNNVISIGDAAYEYRALINLYNHQQGHFDRYLKSIQLKKGPSCENIQEQLKMMNKQIKEICGHTYHMDLEFK